MRMTWVCYTHVQADAEFEPTSVFPLYLSKWMGKKQYGSQVNAANGHMLLMYKVNILDFLFKSCQKVVFNNSAGLFVFSVFSKYLDDF